MNGEIRVLLVDDHALVRGALGNRLALEPGINLVGSADNAQQAIEQTLALEPNIILMDIDMPGLICFDAVRKIRALRPNVRTIFLSGFVHDHYVEQALEVKASGYLTKAEPPETVVTAIRDVASGGAYFSEDVRSRLVVDPSGARLTALNKSRGSTLTPREVEILRYIARGLSKKIIASTMGLSVKTVDRHSTNLMNKLDIHDRVELARFAIREGLANA
jgi:DNA-binding NarL/FixJ family response regulator